MSQIDPVTDALSEAQRDLTIPLRDAFNLGFGTITIRICIHSGVLQEIVTTTERHRKMPKVKQ